MKDVYIGAILTAFLFILPASSGWFTYRHFERKMKRERNKKNIFFTYSAFTFFVVSAIWTTLCVYIHVATSEYMVVKTLFPTYAGSLLFGVPSSIVTGGICAFALTTKSKVEPVTGGNA